MPSSIFSGQSGSSITRAIRQLRSMGNPSIMYDNMYRSNPEFRQFADSMKGKTPQQAFRENGLDFNQINNMFR